jgi:nicotinamidase-related amidase
VRDALLIVDVFQDFEHEDGDALLRSFRARQPALVRALENARSSGVPVVYASGALVDQKSPRARATASS